MGEEKFRFSYRNFPLERLRPFGRLLFTWAIRRGASRSDRLGELKAKFRTGKFQPGYTFTIWTDQFLLPKNGGNNLKLVSKMGLNKWNSTFCWEHSIRKNRTTFLTVRCSLEFSTGMTRNFVFINIPTGISGICWYKRNVNGSARRVAFTFQPEFRNFL